MTGILRFAVAEVRLQPHKTQPVDRQITATGCQSLLCHFQQQIVEPVDERDRVIQLTALAEHGLVEQHI